METKDKPLLSVVLPCFNEADNIPFILARFSEIVRDTIPCEIILVNNGSTDNSQFVFLNELEKYKDARFILVEVEKNLGYGYGILSGLNQANGEVLAWTHADMQTDFLDVFTAYEIYLQHADSKVFVKGARKNRAILPLFFTYAMGLVASLALKTKLHDIGAQPKLFSKSFYQTYVQNEAPFDFSLDLFVQYQAKIYGTIVEFPVYFGKRLHGDAKGGGSLKTRIKVSKRVFSFIFELKKKLKI